MRSAAGNSPEGCIHLDDDFYLRALTATDLEGRWPEWFNDPDVTRFQAKGYFPNSYESQKTYYESLVDSRSDVVFAIADRATSKHIGNVGLHKIEWIHGTAVLGIVIGEKTAWRKGIGTRAWAAITRYGFTVLNLRKICATVVDGNDNSLKCALRAGFVEEGRQAQQMFKNGTYHDLIHVGLLRSNWKSGKV